ncbi:protein Shroom4 isoform X2 [Oryzias melastigma]|uniref:protein Shroom4 isoform X2 n=1 Tax=Oryzias melastigma TaxID=30732 RepID=UPI000CF83E22|nr:protein Shroom4 isoform X2 [Oryzias melastigma]
METVEQLVSFLHIQVQLSGGAPWGFTLKGGLEHGEPLIIIKMEDDGKAAQCKKLKVGDELININGSALYGSRQEALILIKGSYRILNLTVRSDLPIQWALLSRPNSSTDRGSSLGSIESLDTPTLPQQSYSNSLTPPADSTLFSNKRDSAYSSFSASSNMSDYATVPLKPGEANSMSNLLQSFEPTYQDYPCDTLPLGRTSGNSLTEANLTVQKSRSLTRPRPRPSEVKERPFSCLCEKQLRGLDLDILQNEEAVADKKITPPQPPTRKDSFRATQSHPAVSKQCTSALTENDCVSHEGESISRIQSIPVLEDDKNECFKDGTVNSDFIQTHTHNCKDVRCNCFNDSETDSNADLRLEAFSPSKEPVIISGSTSLSSNLEGPEQLVVIHHQTKKSSTLLHRHSAPGKLLATQLQLLELNTNSCSLGPQNSSDIFEYSSSLCATQQFNSSLPHPKTEDKETFHSSPPKSEQVGSSQCSSPDSLFLEEDSKNLSERLVNVSASSLPLQMPLNRSVSVPNEPTRSLTQESLSSLSLEKSNFLPIGAASSVDNLEKETVEADMRRTSGKKDSNRAECMNKSDSLRASRQNRRRSERFATNLRNEIQRKKAQLQHGSDRLPCGGETVHEEGSELNEDGEDPKVSVKRKSSKGTLVSPQISQDFQTSAAAKESDMSSGSRCDVLQIQSTTCSQNNNPTRPIQNADPDARRFGVGIRVVEEIAPVGKARRWRWTPEHKLQPQTEGDRQCGVLGGRVLGVTGSNHGVCGFTSSFTPYCSGSPSYFQMQESDILPFADRMKFFEETSKGATMPNVSNMSIHRQKKHMHHSGELSQHPKQRKFSYQGEPLQESVQPQNNMEFRRQSVSAMMERQIEMEREQVKSRERELKLREKYERDLQKDTGRHKETEQEKEQEEWQRQRARIKQIELGKEKEQSHIKTRGNGLEGERFMEKDEDYPLVSCQECCTNFAMAERNKAFLQIHNHPSFHANQQAFPCCHSQNQVFRSAFHLVSPPDHPVESQQPFSQKCRTRSYTPTEMYHSKQLGASKLSRNYSLSERNYQSWSEQFKPPQRFDQSRCHVLPAQSGPDNSHTFTPPSFLRGRAMSENDLSFDPSKHWSPQISAATSQVLTEVEEGAARTTQQIRKKTPPPPRPPPPKWEQYYQRRASHHALLSCAAARLSNPHPFDNAEGSCLPPSFACNPPPETSRQRSYSLPVERQEVSEGYQPCRCNHPKPPEHGYGPVQSYQNETTYQSSCYPLPQPEQLFRPVAVPHTERMNDVRVRTPASVPTPPPPTESGASSSSSNAVLHNQDRVKLEKPKLSTRPGSDQGRTPSPKGHSNPPPPTDPFPPESSLNQTSTEQQKQLFVSKSFPVQEQRTLSKSVPEPELDHSPSPACSLESDLNVPMETDIDDFPEEEEPPKEDGMLTSELPCFALPVTVLETDIDTLLLDPACSVQSGSCTAEEDVEPGESGRDGLSLKELLLQSREADSSMESGKGHFQAEGGDTNSLERRSGASSSSSFYSTSGSTDQLFSQMKDFTDNKDWEEDNELSYKRQLLQSLRKKLGVLREAQRGLQEDIRANSQLGEEVENMVVSVCKPNEVEKFHMFIGDLDKVLSLLLSLSGRLLKVEALMDSLDPDTDHHERLPLLEKKRQLTRQLSEAQDLKEHIDRREQAVSRVLGRCLTAEQHKDYSHFVKMKAALLVEQRQLEDKIRLGEEQLRGLRESLGLGLGMAKGITMGFRHY